jgi:hypothetical protein
VTPPDHRVEVWAPSEWDVVLAPELAPLFVLDAAIVAAQRFFSIHLDPSSFGPDGPAYPPTRALLETMSSLRSHVRRYRLMEESFLDDPDDALADEVTSDDEGDALPF